MIAPQPLKTTKDTIDRAKHVCLFGVGVLLKECYHQVVLFLGREPDFLCDNAQEKWGKHFFKVKCISPSELVEMRNETVVVVTVKNYEKIFAQLHSLGIKDIFVSCYDRSYNTVCAIKRIEENQSAAPSVAPFSNPVKAKWTLVTGASRGAGRQIALAMAKMGSNIIAHSRAISHLKELVASASALGVQIVPVAAELSNLDQLEAMLSQLDDLAPQIDIVFNNAAIPCRSGFWTSPAKEYIECYTVNAVAPIRICRHLLPKMIKREFGRVINITSSVEKRPETMAYACSKASLDKFVHDLAPSLEGTGVMLTLADPGWLRTGMTDFVGPNAVESIIPGVLLGAVLDGDINGRWFSAQDYAGLSIEAAIEKAKFVSAPSPMNVQTISLPNICEAAG